MSPLCTHCDANAPSDQPHHPELDSLYHIGEVFAIHESVFTPIEDLFATRAVSSLATNERRRCSVELESLRTRKDTTLKSRPCILRAPFESPPGHSDRRGAWICLMATFENAPMAELPRVFHYLCSPVFPNGTVNRGKAHFHSLPEWPELSCWIIAWVFKTTRPLDTRWFTQDSWKTKQRRGYKDQDATSAEGEEEGTRRIGMVFGHQASDELFEHCRRLRQSWMRRCQKDRTLSREYEREYREYRDKIRAQSSSPNSRKTSIVPSCQMMPSRRGGAIATIFEDQSNTEQPQKRAGRDSIAVDGWSTISKKSSSAKKPPTLCGREHQSGDKMGGISSAPAPRKPNLVQMNAKTSTPSVASTKASRNGLIRGGQNVLARFGNRYTALRKKSIGDA
ncbi:hypothetical protein TRAPUB_2637 [Trametes pubescens]|uniref:Uncharacterized protein n=1 Tax=Trametes pubescens TaxID=154538 RepID=A0A1M2VG37_TRAPU|nr:hypothetical protein TRAPUB_2637 [Trametes pubescens]